MQNARFRILFPEISKIISEANIKQSYAEMHFNVLKVKLNIVVCRSLEGDISMQVWHVCSWD